MKLLSFNFLLFILFACGSRVIKPRNVVMENNVNIYGVSVKSNKTGKLSYFDVNTETPYYRTMDLFDHIGTKHKYCEGFNAIRQKKWKKTFYVEVLYDLMKKKKVKITDNVYFKYTDSLTNEVFVLRKRILNDNGSEFELSNLMSYPYNKKNDTLTYNFRYISYDIVNFF